MLMVTTLPLRLPLIRSSEAFPRVFVSVGVNSTVFVGVEDLPLMGRSPRNQSAADDRQPASDLLSEVSEDKGLTQRPPFGVDRGTKYPPRFSEVKCVIH